LNSQLLLQTLLLMIVVISLTVVNADDKTTVRVGVLKFGTVNWELDVIREHGLAEKEGINLEIVPLASKSATHVAIQGGAVDVIVTDWVWVSRQRGEGRDYTFVPYSTAAGGVMVDPKANIESLNDLADKRLGVAGGPVDKSWLLLRAYSQKSLGKDITKMANPNFAAPPLLNELALRGELPAVLNFWHYSARLQAAGFKSLLPISEILNALDIKTPMPLIGWSFHEKWADENKQAVEGFLRASQGAKKILAESDLEWQRLEAMLKAPDDPTRETLRNAYRKGVPTCFDESVIDAATKMYAILAKEGGRDLVGRQMEFSEGTFWKGLKTEPCQNEG